ncbi:MAG: bifunctional diaminohydroxyphosphoribosylaminopyrimidine deaminase/5-amino-6-(5-phosphoribosylamino)uracil reductase RibD [Bacteroidales bacterium]|nr:bifunctional diaminohydroxyphosphoribosylaminopyrimidine deaminase/5-amino-6-(5-phosphoribosylamino)uracil reductase RibD [Bacteroidales bacterium]
MITKENEKFMLRCIELAKLGSGNVSTNPMVGAVIVHNGKIIGEGFHKKFGQAHAEVNAINSVKTPELLKESEIYVSLEPCAHFGKTPPCADLIIQKGIKKVYVGCLDPFSKVDGKGILKLRQAGIEVVTGILEKECQELNRRFFTFVNLKRPYVILKWAQSLDGFLDKDFRPTKISNPLTNILNHKFRKEEDAILIGTSTAERDNPRLDNRLFYGKNPVRIVLDRTLRLKKDLNIFDNRSITIILTEKDVENDLSNTIYKKINFQENLAKNILNALYELNIQSVIIEGGAKTHKIFLEANLWDEIRIFETNEMLFSGTKAAILPKATLTEQTNIADNKFMILKNQCFTIL